MPRDDLTERLRGTFLQELEDQVRELNGGLLALEQRPRDAAIIRTLFRSAHSVKGAARVAGEPAVEDACHALESVFAQARDGDLALDGASFSLLFATVDALAEARDRLRQHGSAEDTSVPALTDRLLALAGGVAPTRSPASASATGEEARGEEARGEEAHGEEARGEEAPGVGTPGVGAPDRAEARGTAAKPAAEPGGRPAPAPGQERSMAVRSESLEELVRVRADRLDSLLSAVGELIVASGRIVERQGRTDEDARRLDRATGAVADVVHHLRLRPFADVCEALPRVARDVAAAAGRQVELELEGQEVEADRMVVDALRDPLLHLVRNAVDHGIEPPEERARRGKPRTGRVLVAAELTGGRMRVTVRDDGAGIDEAAVAAAVRQRTGHAPAGVDDIADALLAGGVTTRGEATAISGRGVGIDLVRSAMERIGGTVDVSWEPGRGTTFTLDCPPTPSSIRALLFRTGPHIFALPTLQVERLRRVHAPDIRHAEGRAILPTPAGPITVQTLAALLGPPLEVRQAEGAAPLIVVRVGDRRVGLIVDEVLDEDEIVVRPLEVDERAVPWATGAAILPSGRIALVLAAGALLGRSARAGTTIAPAFAPPRETPRPRVLVADDSITTRTLEQSVLEAGGFDVITAVNGEDAWQRLEAEGADLIVADVEMPRMDGFALCRRVRASSRFSDLPIVLVTGLESEDDRARGLEAGADAYIVKSSFDQASLVDTVRQLVGQR
jgi:two-component system, chemotaxis family, sensor kinase CheA